MTQSKEKFASQAVQLVKSGTMTPEWSLQILRKKDKQNVYEPIKGQFVDGYVQWKPKDQGH